MKFPRLHILYRVTVCMCVRNCIKAINIKKEVVEQP